MKKTIAILILFTFVFLTGCIPSLHPFYTDADVYFDRNLLGTWTDADEQESWTFASEGEKEYQMTYTDESGKKGLFEARLFKLGERSFLDITPVRPELKNNDFYTSHLLSLHSVVQLAVTGRTARMSCLDPDWLKKTLEKNPSALQHTVIDGDILLTDTTPNIKAFLAANLNTAGAFNKSTTVTRKEAKR